MEVLVHTHIYKNIITRNQKERSAHELLMLRSEQ